MGNHENRPSGLSEVRFSKEDFDSSANRPVVDLVARYFDGVWPKESETPEEPLIYLDTDGVKKSKLDYHEMHRFEVPGIPGFVIVPKSFEDYINEKPESHKNGSGAKYIIDGLVMENGHALFLSIIDEGLTTSHHHHEEPLSEDYWILHGRALVGDQITEDHLHAPSNTDHQVTTEDPRILFIAQLRYAGRVPRELWHTPLK